MPPTLIDSQFAGLEEPTGDERPTEADEIAAPDANVTGLADHSAKQAGA
jgi:hypothetical protein